MLDIAKGYTINNNWVQKTIPSDFVQNQPEAQNKNQLPSKVSKTSNKKLLYSSIGFVAGASILGGLTYLRSKKNIKLKYAGFVKERIKEFLKLPEAKPYVKKIEYEKMYYEENKNNPAYKDLVKGSKYFNFITYYKNLKNALAKKTEYFKTHTPDLEDEKELSNLNIKILNIQKLLLDMKVAFNYKQIDKTVYACMKNSAIGGVLGAGVSYGINYLTGRKNEN